MISTEHTQNLQEELARSQEQFELLFEYALDAIIFIDPNDLSIVKANQNFGSLFGANSLELIGSNPLEFSPVWQPSGRSSLEILQDKIGEALLGMRPTFEWWFYNFESKPFPCEFRLMKFPMDGKTLIRASLVDISEKQKVVQQIKDSEERISMILNNTSDALILFKVEEDLSYTVCTVNKTWIRQIFKVGILIQEELVLGQNLERVVGDYLRNPQLIQEFKKRFEKCRTDRFPLSYEDHMGENPLQMRWFENRLIPVLGERKHCKWILWTSRDISQRKQMEEELLELNNGLEKRVAERTAHLEATLAELESFTYSVSHDFRSPLRIIDGFGSSLLEDLEGDIRPEVVNQVHQIRHNAKRMGSLIEDLLYLSKIVRQPLVKKNVNLTELAHTVSENLLQNYKHLDANVMIEPQLQAYGDADLIEVFIHHIFDNAFKFSSHSKHIQILLGLRMYQGLPCFFIKDNGLGLDIQFKNRLFSPFHRLHQDPEIKGNGIGLALCQRIAHRHGGFIDIEAEIGVGCTIWFRLSEKESNSHLAEF